MNKSRNIILLAVVMLAGLWATSEYNIHAKKGSIGPDVIVGDLPDITRWGTSGGVTSFSIATTSCNIGDENLTWFSNTPAHPVIPQSLYRVKDGRIEQIGISWLKHGFFALSQNLCGSCSGTNGSALGVGCSDPYGASLNGSQGGLGPRSEVNAATGVFPMPHSTLTNAERGTHGGRIQVASIEITPSQNSGARYFGDSHYVHPEDTQEGNDLNSSSYREAFISVRNGTPDVRFNNSPMRREDPAILAWKEVHPDVQIFNVDVPNDGRFIIGMRTVGNHIEIAVQNFNSHLSARSLKVSFNSGNVSNPGFRDVDYHAEDYAGTDWVPTITGSEVEWATDTFAQDQDANALRWNTLYSFWIDADECPSSMTLGLFRPGGPSEMVVDVCPTVFPSSFVVAQGDAAGGDASSLGASDDADLSVRRSNQDVQSRTEVEMTSASPTASPSSIDVTLESSVFSRTQVNQTIDLFNFDSGSWEVISSEVASRFADSTVSASASGDLSRFVGGSNEIRARVVHESDNNPRQRFTSHHDLFSWTIGM